MDLQSDTLRAAAAALLTAVTISYAYFAGPLEGNYNTWGLPLLLLENPSHISSQQGIPLGVQYYYDNQTKNLSMKTGGILPFATNAVSFDYSQNDGPLSHRVSAGVSHLESPFEFGGACTFAFDNSTPHLAIDGGVSLVDNFGGSLSLTGATLLGSDSLVQQVIPTTFTLSYAAPLLKSYLTIDGSITAQIPQYVADSMSYGGNLWIRSSFLKHNVLTAALGVALSGYQPKTNIGEQKIAGCDLGYIAKFGAVTAGILSGYRFDIVNKRESGIYLGLLFNPSQNLDFTPPRIRMRVMPDSAEGGFYFSLWADDGERGSGVKEWTLVIATAPDSHAEIIKAYTGGNLPPSSIYWDTRDSKGEVYDQKASYARFIAVDRCDNISVSDWIQLQHEPPLSPR